MPQYDFKPGDVIDTGTRLLRIVQRGPGNENIYLAKDLFELKPHLFVFGKGAKVVARIEPDATS